MSPYTSVFLHFTFVYLPIKYFVLRKEVKASIHVTVVNATSKSESPKSNSFNMYKIVKEKIVLSCRIQISVLHNV